MLYGYSFPLEVDGCNYGGLRMFIAGGRGIPEGGRGIFLPGGRGMFLPGGGGILPPIWPITFGVYYESWLLDGLSLLSILPSLSLFAIPIYKEFIIFEVFGGDFVSS